MSNVTLMQGDCIEKMKEMDDNSVDSIVTDPPYGLGFMGKKWDALPPSLEVFEECLRVLKPGGHLLAFGGSRTSSGEDSTSPASMTPRGISCRGRGMRRGLSSDCKANAGGLHREDAGTGRQQRGFDCH